MCLKPIGLSRFVVNFASTANFTAAFTGIFDFVVANNNLPDAVIPYSFSACGFFFDISQNYYASSPNFNVDAVLRRGGQTVPFVSGTGLLTNQSGGSFTAGSGISFMGNAQPWVNSGFELKTPFDEIRFGIYYSLPAGYVPLPSTYSFNGTIELLFCKGFC